MQTRMLMHYNNQVDVAVVDLSVLIKLKIDEPAKSDLEANRRTVAIERMVDAIGRLVDGYIEKNNGTAPTDLIQKD
jgi:hypothetical protein